MLSLRATVIALVVCSALSFSTGWVVKGKFVKAAQLEEYQEQVRAAQLAQQEANDRAADLEKKLADERKKAKAINSKLEKALVENPDYARCKLPAGGVQLLNDAVAGNPAR